MKKMNVTSKRRGWACLLALTVLAAIAAPQGKVFNNSISNVKKPGLVLGKGFEDLGKELGGTPNSDVRQSGFSLQRYFDKPFARELVWAYDLTDPMSLVFNDEGWISSDNARRTVRMYYHVGFDERGRAVAAAQWFKGPSTARSADQIGKQPASKSQPAYWGYEFGQVMADYGLSESRPLELLHREGRKSLGGSAHKCPKDAICSRCGFDGRGQRGIAQAGLIGILLPGPWGLAMATANEGPVSLAIVGEVWGISSQPTVRPSNAPPAWMIRAEGDLGSKSWSISDVLLILAWTRDNEPPRGKILPTTNDKRTECRHGSMSCKCGG